MSRYEIKLENYCKLCNIEAVTIYKQVKKHILPTAVKCAGELSESAMRKRELLGEIPLRYERDSVKRISEITDGLHKKVSELLKRLENAENKTDILKRANYYKDEVLTKMLEIRELADELELLLPAENWCFPTYGDLLFSVR